MLEIMMGFGKSSGGDREPLLAGTYEHGYYGEVLATEFITGNDLATQIGLTTGTAFNSDAGWLKFSLDYKTLYVAKRPFRYAISWNSINARGAVFGDTQVEINGKQYKVRLLKGRGDGRTTAFVNGYDVTPTHNSEWNRLIYHVAASPNAGQMTSEGISAGDWVQVSNIDLGINNGNGGYSWCSDLAGTNRVLRGMYNPSYMANDASSTSIAPFGWRPVLELVE